MLDPVVGKGWVDLHPEARLVDVRWYLDDREGRDAYERGHIPGAGFIDLDAYLAAPPTAATGRHPLPDPEVFAEGMRKAGISDGVPVVAYDDAGGAVAARLVWLLRVLGHDAALLNGGLQNWSGELEEGPGQETAEGDFAAQPWPADAFASMDEVAQAETVIDARAPERYRGETEPIDARAGHIPGAINLPFDRNLREDKTFLDVDALKVRYSGHGIHNAQDAVVYCGSGVTACHALLAMEYAGLGKARLYPGSWSQWAATDRPADGHPESA